MTRIFKVCLFLCSVLGLNAQMNFNSQSLYGNEWIKPGSEYYKIKIAEDGMYKISFQQLQQAGIPGGSVSADKFQLIKFGTDVPLIRSTVSLMGPTDYLLFYGKKNRAELDLPLFDNPNDLMNREYSMYNDTAVYYLSWENSANSSVVQRIQNDLSVPMPKDEYFLNTKVSIFADEHFKRSNGEQHEQKYPLFDACQGYSTETFQSKTFALQMENAYLSGPDAKIDVTYGGYGSDGTSHNASFQLDGDQINNDLFSGYQMRSNVFDVPAGDLKDNMQLKIDAIASPEDYLAVSVIEYTYARTFDFNQNKFAKIILEASVTRKYLEIDDFDGADEIVVYDLTNHFYLYSTKESNGSYRVNIPASSEKREILIFNKSEIKNTPALQKVNFLNLNSGDYNFVILYHPKLTDDDNGNNYIQQYLDYRSSPEGGSYQVAAINVENLYDMFSYGIHTHPLAVKNFAQYVNTIWPKLKYFLILGKGLDYYSYRKTGLDPTYFFVPTYSYPAADMMLITDKDKLPLYSFGRLPVINGTELKIYLDKIKSHENYLRSSQHNIESKEWQKRIVHLSGGDPLIYQWISNELRTMEDTIENNLFGANVETFYKQSSGTIEVSNSEKLKAAINEGSSIIAFMGHSASIRLDFNLENVDSYKNKDKYHLFMAMGCYAGSMFSPNRSISEDHNLAPDKGSIIYLANTTAGFANILGIYGREFYNQLGTTYYGKPIGDALKATFSILQKIGGETLLTQTYSTSFNGDPAIQLNINKYQDYTLDPKTVTTNPSLVFSSQKEFQLTFDVVSLGAYFKDSILLTIDKKLSTGKLITVYNTKIANPASRTTLTIPIPVGGDTAIGYNTLYIKLDGQDEIAEGPLADAENNNELIINGQRGYSFYIFGNEARPVYPQEFAIVNKSNLKLIANNGNTFASITNYYLEIDTTEYFNSPLKKSTKINQTGGVITWLPNVSLVPNTVYYWRAAPDSIGSGVFAWRNSSFIYLPNSSEGWNQSHFFQHKKNDFYKMQIQEPDRTFKYSEAIIDFRANNGYIAQPTYIRPRVYVGTDVASDYQYFWQQPADYSGVIINVFDPVTGKMWINKTGGDYNSYFRSGFADKPFFVFKTSTVSERSSLIDFLENGIPFNHIVIFSTLTQYQYSYYPELWESDGTKNIYSVLESFGSKSVRNLKTLNSVPYIMIYRKGRSDFEVKESIGNFMDEVDVSHSFSILQTSGSVQSRLVGPAKSWSTYLWDHKNFNVNEDQQEINIYGVDPNGTESLLFGPFTQSEQDLNNIDSKKYPQLKLEWKSNDTTSRSAPELNYWRVLYEGLPDAAFNPYLVYEINKDTLNQGDLFEIKIAAQNIGSTGLDSLLVKFTVVNQVNQVISSYKRFIPLASLATVNIPFSFKTTNSYGAHKLFIELNPDNDQPELHTFNNTAIIPFYVRRDKRKPYIEVTFDKLKILNEDIVSSKSVIEIILQDENKDLLLNDTTIFTLKIKEPGGSPQRVYFAQNNVSFVPAGTDNKVKAIIRGDFHKDGIHSLYVTAVDGSGNTATDQDYIIDFTIVSKSSVGNLLNYPNPFTTKTRFVYTLTGDAPPENYMIQILTVSGKVVKVITKEELGPLSIGTHMTDYEYNATDDFGERLANGVYLYRFVVKDKNKNSWDKYDTGTDQYFKNDFGKMVIIR